MSARNREIFSWKRSLKERGLVRSDLSFHLALWKLGSRQDSSAVRKWLWVLLCPFFIYRNQEIKTVRDVLNI